jgi:predicted ATPase/transcriptional regulator with XRE-family HTH domain/Tfp pilus assembly protein PilF
MAPEQAAESFGALLRAYRARRGLSQDDLADRTGLSVAAISAMERGLTRWPYRDTIARLAQAMDLLAVERDALAAAGRRPVRDRSSASPSVTGLVDSATSVARSNLPIPLTGLIGRDAELNRLEHLFTQPRSRLLTVSGPGGVGKTRLAIEVAGRLQGDFPDGVFFVSLAPIQDVLLLPSTLARAFGMVELDGASVMEDLMDFIGGRRLLLVLDNCEHLIDACADSAAMLLAACPGLHVLATSRSALRIRGEQVFLLQPLPLPALSVDTPSAAIEQSPAVALFAERAREAYPDFSLSSSNLGDVAAICERVDGLPLAIELAAAQCAYASPRALLARLTPSLPLLHGGAHDLPARQQTLRNTIDWSYRLLTQDSRRVFRHLAVCVGGFGVDASAAVCDLESSDLVAVLFELENLVAASLLIAEQGSDVEPRFSMLETIRDFGLERLAESGELDVARTRHLAWCLALAERAAPELTGPEQERWLHRLDIEHANLQAALQYATPPREVGVRLAVALWRFWYTRGYLAVGRRWLEAAVAAEAVSVATQASALHGAGMLAWRQGDYEQASAWHQESLALRQALGDRQGIASSLENLGMVAWRQSDYAQARALLEQSLALRRELDDQQGAASSLHSLGTAMAEQGEYAAAEIVYRESLAIRRQLGDKQGVAGSLNALGMLASELGDDAAAASLHAESLALARELGDQKGIANSLNNLGNIADARGDFEDAERLHHESLAIMRELDDRQGIAASLNNLGRIAYERGTYDAARALLEESLLRSSSIGAKYQVIETLEVLALLAASLGDARRAARLYGAAASLRKAIGAPVGPREHPARERVVASLRKQLGPRRFTEAWTAGEALSLDQAIVEARASP